MVAPDLSDARREAITRQHEAAGVALGAKLQCVLGVSDEFRLASGAHIRGADIQNRCLWNFLATRGCSTSIIQAPYRAPATSYPQTCTHMEPAPKLRTARYALGPDFFVRRESSREGGYSETRGRGRAIGWRVEIRLARGPAARRPTHAAAQHLHGGSVHRRAPHLALLPAVHRLLL